MNNRPQLIYSELLKYLKLKNIEKPTYEDLLWTYEWQVFRLDVFEKDNLTCTKCGSSKWIKKTEAEYAGEMVKFGKYFNPLSGEYEDNPSKHSWNKETRIPNEFKVDTSIQLDAHHNYYILGKNPWEYSLDALSTLCHECHRNYHLTNKPLIYTNDSLTQTTSLEECDRCGGSGYLEQFWYYEGGTCFKCGGLGGY